MAEGSTFRLIIDGKDVLGSSKDLSIVDNVPVFMAFNGFCTKVRYENSDRIVCEVCCEETCQV